MKKIIYCSLVLLLLFSFTGCEDIGEQLKEDITEKLLENLIGDNAQVDITYPDDTGEDKPEPTPGSTDGITSDAEIKWPDDIPDDVPEVSFDIQNSLKTPNGVILDYGKIDKINVTDYIDFLMDNQFETEKEEISKNLIDSTYKNGDTSVKIYWYENGSLTLMITWE